MFTRLTAARRGTSVAVCLLLATAFAGCDSPARPGAGRVELTTTLSPSRVTAGDGVTVTSRLTNTGSDALDLTLGSPCFADPEVRLLSTGANVAPPRGCVQVIREVVLQPGESVDDVSTIPTSATPTSGVPIGPGRYAVSATARLPVLGLTLRSMAVTLTVE